MTIRERMVARSEREKDLLKYGRSQERERIIKLLEELEAVGSDPVTFDYKSTAELIALIKGEK